MAQNGKNLLANIRWISQSGQDLEIMIKLKIQLNLFWKSVAIAFAKWYKILDLNNYISPVYQPIWGNAKMNIPFNKNLFKGNIIFISDLFDNEGNNRTKESLEITIGSNVMFTTYPAIWRSMPNDWRQTMRGELKQFNLALPPLLAWLLKDQKAQKTSGVYGQSIIKIKYLSDARNGLWN